MAVGATMEPGAPHDVEDRPCRSSYCACVNFCGVGDSVMTGRNVAGGDYQLVEDEVCGRGVGPLLFVGESEAGRAALGMHPGIENGLGIGCALQE